MAKTSSRKKEVTEQQEAPPQVVAMTQRRPDQSLAKINPQALLEAAIEKGASVETLERLVSLIKDVRSQQAKAAFDDAMAEFQRQCPPIMRTRTARIQTRSGGGYSYSFAPLEEIMEKISPVLGPLGLHVSYRIKQDPEAVTAVCIVSHALGHAEESGEVTMPIVVMRDQGGNVIGANPAQCVGIAMSYAKRYALLAKLGIAPQGEDMDGGQNAEPEFREPQRASDRKQPAVKPSEQKSGERSRGSITGKIASIREGKSSRGSTFLMIKLKGLDYEFSTFDSAQLENLQIAEKSGNSVAIDYEEKVSGDKTYRNIVDWWMAKE